MSEKMGEVSAMNRLKKAAALGFGPLMDRSEKPPATRSRSRSPPSRGIPSCGVSEPSTSNSAVVAVREQQERRREALRQVSKGPEDESDINGFLCAPATKKPAKPGAPARLDLKVSSGPVSVNTSKLDLNLKISSGTTERAAAAAQGARPKASAKAASKSKEAEELLQRQMEEKATQEFEEMQRAVRPQVGARDDEVESRYYDEESLDSSEEDRRWRKREEKKKRDEWRKKRREELKKSGAVGGKRSSDSEGEEIDEEALEAQRKEREHAKMRAQTWRTINNNGRYSKVAGSYVGQLSDRELDKKIAEAARQNAASNLMSEAEVLAKMQKGKNVATGPRKKSRSKSPKRLR